MQLNDENQGSVEGNTPQAAQQDYTGPMAMVTVLFFIWGFLTCMNDLLIPYFQKAFVLSDFEVMLVQTAFFFAYFVGALAYFLISASSGDPIAKIGYKNGILIGLAVAALGAFLFYPAAVMVSYPFFLLALFVLALGFTMLQISANPYVAVLGSEKTASSRLNLSQGFNSLGTTLAPIVGSILIFAKISGDAGGVENVKMPYLIISGILVLVALAFAVVRLPQIQGEGTMEKKPVSLRFRHVRMGMAAIFCYVGAEVAIGSMLILYFSLPEIGNLNEDTASLFVAIYWGGAMIGRFLGAISLSDISSQMRKMLLMAVTAILCFGMIFTAVWFKDNAFGFSEIWPFLLLIALNYAAFLLGRSMPARSLSIFAVFSIALLILTILSSGKVAMWAVIGIGLFNSIMWSNIFTLAIAGLGKYKSQASSLLVMMIIGGAILPPLQGALADILGRQASFILPIFAYLYLAYYGLQGYRVINPGVKVD